MSNICCVHNNLTDWGTLFPRTYGLVAFQCSRVVPGGLRHPFRNLRHDAQRFRIAIEILRHLHRKKDPCIVAFHSSKHRVHWYEMHVHVHMYTYVLWNAVKVYMCVPVAWREKWLSGENNNLVCVLVYNYNWNINKGDRFPWVASRILKFDLEKNPKNMQFVCHLHEESIHMLFSGVDKSQLEYRLSFIFRLFLEIPNCCQHEARFQKHLQSSDFFKYGKDNGC